MLLKLKYIILVCCLISVSNTIFAQYKGGNTSGGGEINSLIQAPCTTPPENTSIYFGGNANGAAISVVGVTCVSIPENISIYFGGKANGAASSKTTPLTICTPPENLNVFIGGIGGKATLAFTYCIPPENTNIFYGGNANDAASATITNCPVSTPVNIFIGGNADGYNVNLLTQQSCAISENTNIFLGGNADGMANTILHQTDCSTPEAVSMFFGGITDGFANLKFNQTTCADAENTNIFLGGNADGYSKALLTLQVCPPLENYNISLGGNANGDALITLTQSICALPENTQIFQGGIANGDAITLLNQTACTYPENINIFLGGFSNGDAIQFLNQQTCSIPENINIFKGGFSDGYSILKIQQTTCPAPENINPYAGGNADGYAFRNLAQQTCTAPVNISVSFGGVGDGNAISSLVKCIPPENINIYYGGIDNGMSSPSLLNCPIASPVNIYNGGNANGAAIAILTASACPAAQNISIYFGGTANGASMAQLIKNTCPPAENINIYLGGNANGAALSRKYTACAIPDNWNIYFGGNANGAANSRKYIPCPVPDNLNIYFGGNENGAASGQKVISVCTPLENWNVFFGGIADGYAYRLLIQPYYWTGAIDHNWHNPLNWSTEVVPDISALAIIPNVPNYPIVSLAAAQTKGLVIQTGAKVNITNQNFTSEFSVANDGALNITGTPLITIGGDFHNENGTITTDNAKFLFNAAVGTQTINMNSTAVAEVEVATAPSASCQLAGNMTINKNLTISAGNLNASSYNILLNGNWSDAGSFTPGTGTVLFNGTYQTISNTLGEHFYNVTTQNNTQVVIQNNTQVTNNLTLTSGTISTATNILTLGSSIATPGTLNYVSGRIVGKFEKWIAANGSYLFPIGNSTNYQAINFNVNSGLTGGSILTYFVTGNPGNGGLPITESGISVQNQYTEGYWNITANNNFAVSNFNISLAANGFSSYYFNPDTRVIKRTNNGGWGFDGTHVNASNPNCFRNNLTGGISNLGTQFGIGAMACIAGTVSDNYTICYNDDVPPFLSVDAAHGGDGSFTYTWQYTNDPLAVPGDGNWTDLPSSNATTIDYGTLTATTRFVRTAVNVGCPTALYSNILLIKVALKPQPQYIYRLKN